jgi:hypothetical protein
VGRQRVLALGKAKGRMLTGLAVLAVHSAVAVRGPGMIEVAAFTKSFVHA